MDTADRRCADELSHIPHWYGVETGRCWCDGRPSKPLTKAERKRDAVMREGLASAKPISSEALDRIADLLGGAA